MSMAEHDPVSRLNFELSKLPGVGEKSATRLAYFILKQSPEYAENLSTAIVSAKQKTGLCTECFTFTEASPCRICANADRDAGILCVVERPSDVLSLERASAHRGHYHVLHGVLSPLDGIGPEELRIRELLARVQRGLNTGGASVLREIVLATNPSVEGEATALYLSRLLKPFGLRITQLAYGLPVGGLLEYSDRQTIGRAMENRMEIA